MGRGRKGAVTADPGKKSTAAEGVGEERVDGGPRGAAAQPDDEQEEGKREQWRKLKVGKVGEWRRQGRVTVGECWMW